MQMCIHQRLVAGARLFLQCQLSVGDVLLLATLKWMESSAFMFVVVLIKMEMI